jgi:hypothetical protein
MGPAGTRVRGVEACSSRVKILRVHVKCDTTLRVKQSGPPGPAPLVFTSRVRKHAGQVAELHH